MIVAVHEGQADRCNRCWDCRRVGALMAGWRRGSSGSIPSSVCLAALVAILGTEMADLGERLRTLETQAHERRLG